MGHVQQVHAALGVREGAYAQAVGGMQLLHQEVAADLDDLRELKEASRRQQALDGLLFQLKDTYNVRTIKKHTHTHTYAAQVRGRGGQKQLRNQVLNQRGAQTDREECSLTGPLCCSTRGRRYVVPSSFMIKMGALFYCFEQHFFFLQQAAQSGFVL